MLLEVDHLPALARGCALMGSGGGGDPTIGMLMAREAILSHGPVPLVDLIDLPGDGLVMPCGYVGAPTVLVEKLQNGWEGRRLLEEVEAIWGKPVCAIMPIEIGGCNGFVPLAWAARLGLPYVDADGMGRAFPTIPQMTMHLAGVPSSPCILVDERMNTVVIKSDTVEWTEQLLRNTMSTWGSAAGAMYVMTAGVARDATVRGSVSRALNLGAAVLCRNGDPVASLLTELGAVELIRGKVVDVVRETSGGFVRGSAVVEDHAGEGRLLRLEMQNEFLVALEGGQVLASVPDIITAVDVHSGDVIVTERLRYGQQVSVVAFPSDPVWRTERGLEVAGPGAFGYEFPYLPVESINAGPV